MTRLKVALALVLNLNKCDTRVSNISKKYPNKQQHQTQKGRNNVAPNLIPMGKRMIKFSVLLEQEDCKYYYCNE